MCTILLKKYLYSEIDKTLTLCLHALVEGQGNRMSVHYLACAHNPAIKNFSSNSGVIKQRFRLPTMLSFVGSFCISGMHLRSC
jgi:hypothetical protein